MKFKEREPLLYLFPVFQLWQLSLKAGSDLLRGPDFIGRMTSQKIQQFLKVCIDEFPVSIAPLVIFLYMAVMDDEICRNELEGNRIGDQVISFAPGRRPCRSGTISFWS